MPGAGRRKVSTALAALAVATVGCTTTYTDADLAREEVRQEDEAHSEEKRDREIGEQGGGNLQAIEGDIILNDDGEGMLDD